MIYSRQHRRNSRIPGKRPGDNSQMSTTGLSTELSPPVSNEFKTDIEDHEWCMSHLISSLTARDEEQNLSNSSSADLFEERDDEESQLIQENKEIETRIRSLQRNIKESCLQCEKVRADIVDKISQERELLEKIKLKNSHVDRNCKIWLNNLSAELELPIFYEPLFKFLKIDPRNPTCGEQKPILLKNEEASTSESCDFWNCPIVSGETNAIMQNGGQGWIGHTGRGREDMSFIG